MIADGKMDVQLDVSKGSRVSRLEVIEGPTGRRNRSAAEKAKIAAESLCRDNRNLYLVEVHASSEQPPSKDRNIDNYHGRRIRKDATGNLFWAASKFNLSYHFRG